MEPMVLSAILGVVFGGIAMLCAFVGRDSNEKAFVVATTVSGCLSITAFTVCGVYAVMAGGSALLVPLGLIVGLGIAFFVLFEIFG